ncbi:MAG: glycosyltransferase family 2 protein [Flavobacteriaceae bacterium]|nr:glycosyltransferase family 2 protein [Flavobacteriaceae bacterium]
MSHLSNFEGIRVIIPAFNEEASIGKVLQAIPTFVEEVIVVNNASTDQTEKVARQASATVLTEKRMGYGYACLQGIDYIKKNHPQTKIVVFLDGDFSDFPEYLTALVQPIIENDFDLVIGARVKKLREKGAMTLPQIFGNWLATRLMKIMYKANYTDLGPFRAIRFKQFLALHMQDKTYGWTVEMQLKALQHQLNYTEIEVPYRNRIGVSKVSGTLKGAFMAGVKIIGWIFKYGMQKQKKQ